MKAKTIAILILLLCCSAVCAILMLFARGKGDLLDAAVRGSMIDIERLVEEGADVNMRESEGRMSPLHLLAERTVVRPGDKAIAHHELARIAGYLIDHGADIEAKTKVGQTPLFLAASLGNVELVTALVTRGANVNTQDESGDTPLHVGVARAVFTGEMRLVRLLLQNGAKTNLKNKMGETPADVLITLRTYQDLKATERERVQKVEKLLLKYTQPTP